MSSICQIALNQEGSGLFPNFKNVEWRSIEWKMNEGCTFSILCPDTFGRTFFLAKFRQVGTLENVRFPKGHKEIVFPFSLRSGFPHYAHFHKTSWVCYTAAPSSGEIFSHFKLQLTFCEALAVFRRHWDFLQLRLYSACSFLRCRKIRTAVRAVGLSAKQSSGWKGYDSALCSAPDLLNQLGRDISLCKLQFCHLRTRENDEYL